MSNLRFFTNWKTGRISRKTKSQSVTELAFRMKMEAPTRFERVMEVLQTSALPLGDGAGIAVDPPFKARY